MLVCIDESGDPGFKFSEGSSEYFTCVAVIFTDDFSANACDNTINQARRILKLKPGFEFHFTECSDKVRAEFFKLVSQESFKYYGFVLNKPKLYGKQFSDKHGFYNFTVGLICENARSLLRNAKVIIDECGDRNFKR